MNNFTVSILNTDTFRTRTLEGQSVDAAVTLVSRLSDNESAVITPEPLAEFDVFYGSDSIELGWSQHRTVKAANFRQAMLEGMKNSQHHTGRRYLVMGMENGQKVGRVFEITRVDWYNAYDTRIDTRGVPAPHSPGYYTIKEVKVV